MSTCRAFVLVVSLAAAASIALAQSPAPSSSFDAARDAAVQRARDAAVGTVEQRGQDPGATQVIELSPEAIERLNAASRSGALTVSPPALQTGGGTAFVDDPRGVARRGPVQGPGAVWMENVAPGILVVKPKAGATGVQNLSTGVPQPGVAP